MWRTSVRPYPMNSNDGVRCYRYINCFSDAMAQRWKSHATRPLMLPDGSTRCTNSTPIKFYIGWHQQLKSDWGLKKENFNVISSRIGEWKKRWRRRRKQKGRFELFFFGFFRNLRQSLATCPTSRQSDKGLAIRCDVSGITSRIVIKKIELSSSCTSRSLQSSVCLRQRQFAIVWTWANVSEGEGVGAGTRTTGDGIYVRERDVIDAFLPERDSV